MSTKSFVFVYNEDKAFNHTKLVHIRSLIIKETQTMISFIVIKKGTYTEMIQDKNYIDDECYGYCRCSKARVQDAEYEIRALMKLGIKRDHIYVDYQSGASDNRENLNKVLSIMKPGISSLFCTDITRLVRNTRFFCELLSYIEEHKLRLVVGSLDVDVRQEKLDVMVEGMLKINAVCGEMERKLKIFQINLGLDNARAEGVKLGRPTTSYDDIPEIFFRYLPMYNNETINKSEFSRLTGLSYPTIYKYIGIVNKVS